MSEESIPPPAEQDVRAPRIALVGVILILLTLLIVVIAVVVAVIRLREDDDDTSASVRAIPEITRENALELSKSAAA